LVLSAEDVTTLGNGTISVSAVATDAAGNASSAGTSSFTLSLLSITSPDVATPIDENLASGALVYTATSAQQGVTFTLNQAAAVVGDASTITQTSASRVTDTLGTGVTLTRGTTGPMVSNLMEDGTPTIEWNSDGWAHLGNVAGRTYTSFANALNNKVGDYILPAELVIHDRVNDTYFKVDFTQYQGGGNGGAFSYQRSQITLSAENNFEINEQGEVFLIASPDYEDRPAYEFTVVATDASGNVVQKTVSLAINNLDDHAPEITSANAARTLMMGTGANQVIYTTTSDDSNDISIGSVTYSLAAPPQAILGDTVDVSLPSKSFYRGMDYTDVIAPGVGFSRGVMYAGFAVSAQWNTDGWDNLGQVANRAYDIEMPYDRDSLVMHDIFADRYYKLDFSAEGGGYLRTEIFADGTLGDSTEVSPETLATTGDTISSGLTLRMSEGSSDIQSLSVAPTVVWNDEGWDDLSDVAERTYDAEVKGNTATTTEWVMHDTVNDTYYTVDFSKWSNGNFGKYAVGGSGGFAYERRQIDLTSPSTPALGESVQVFVSDGAQPPADQLDSGAALTRLWAFPLQGVQTVEWNADGWGDDLTDAVTRDYTPNMALAVILDPNDYEGLDNVVLDRQWLMHDLVNDSYYKVEFHSWQQEGGGGFAYTRSQIDVQTGELLNTAEFTKSADTPFDLVDTGVVISRGMQRPLNSSGIEWNGDGWDDLEDVASRDFYTNSSDAKDGDWTDTEFVMRDLLSGRYYKIDVTDWQEGGGGAVSYERSEIIQQLGETGLTLGDFTINPNTGEVRLLVDPLPENSPYKLVVVASDAAGNESHQDVSMVVQPNYAPVFQMVNKDSSVPAGLVAYWQMDEGTGTVTKDSGPNGLDANLMKTASWAADGAPGFPADKSVSLSNDLGSYLQVPDNPLFNLDQGFTLSAWAKPTDDNSNTVIDRGHYNFLFQIGTGLGFYNSSTGWLRSTTPIDVGAWVHVAVSWDPDSDTIKLYKDGVLTDTFSDIQPLSFNPGELNIGRQSPNADKGNEMDGQLDEVAIYNRALSQAQINRLMQDGALEKEAVAFANLTEGIAYQAKATDANAGTTLTYGLLNSADAALFNIDTATGAVRFKEAPDMVDPLDAGENNIYNITVTASDGVNAPAELAVSIEVLVPPSIAPTASASFDEKTTDVVYTAQAVGSKLTYSLAGADAALFAIDTGTGELRFVNAPDFENPLDAGRNNVYDVSVVANTYNLSASQQLTVTVGNVYEAPVLQAGNSWATSFDEGTLSNRLHIDLPEPSRASVVLNTQSQQLDFFALDPNGLDMWGNRNGAPIVWADSPVVGLGQSWSVQSRVLIKDGLQDPEQIAGIVFYDADGGVPNFYFALTEWLQWQEASVATQNLNGLSGETHTLLAPDTADVYLKVLVTERGHSDDYQFFYKGQLADPWIAVGNASTYTSPGNDSRVGLVYKTRRDAAGVSFDDFAITAPVSVAENTAGTVYTAQATAESGSTLTYALSGNDAGLFNLNAQTGAVSFKAAPDFEGPRDEGSDNVYNVTITASDGTASSEPQSVLIAVTNVVEPSSVSLTVSPAKVAEGDTAKLVYTFSRSGDIGDALTVNIGYGGTASSSTDYAIEGPFGKSWSTLVGGSRQDKLLSITAAADGGFYAVGQGEYYSASNPMISADGVVQPFFGWSDAFISKYSASGDQLWTRVYGGAAGYDEATSVTVDSTGFAYVVGYGKGTSDAGTNTTFLTRYSPSGGLDASWELTNLEQPGWDKRTVVLTSDESTLLILSTSNSQRTVITEVPVEPDGFGSATSFAYFSDRVATAIATTSDGLVYLTGSTQSDFGDQSNAGGGDAFLSKLKSDGTVAWSRLIGGSSWDSGTSVVVGSDGGVYVAGFIDSSYFVNKFDANGASAWSTTIANGSNYASSLVMGSDGFVYLSGVTTRAIDGQAVLGGNDAFITRIDPESGQRTFTRILGSDGDDRATAIAAGPTGEVLIGGTAHKSYGNVYDNLPSLGSLDGFVTQFAPPTLPTTVTFAPGSATATLTPKIKADEQTEEDETLALTVLSGEGYNIGSSASATGTIRDAAVVSVQIEGSSSVSEGDGDPLVFAFTRTGDTTEELKIAVSYNGSASRVLDYELAQPEPSLSVLVGDTKDDFLNSVAVTSDGGFYAVGQASGYTTTPMTSADGESLTHPSNFSALISKYNAQGQPEWTRVYGGAGENAATSVVVGADGSAYVTGYGDGPDGANNTFIVKYSASGDQEWELTGLEPQIYDARSLALAPDGSALFVGGLLNGYSGREAFITRVALNPDGTPGTPQSFNLTERAASAIATAGDGSMYLTGFTEYDIDGQTKAGGTDAFVSKLDSAGAVVWSRLIGGLGEDFGTSVLVGPDGAVYVAGGSHLYSPTPNHSIFLSKFDSAGTLLWEQTIPNGVGADKANKPCSLAMGSDGFVYISGTTTQGIELQDEDYYGDAFVSQIDPVSGNIFWTQVYGGSGDNRPTALAAGPSGEVYIGGYTYLNYEDLLTIDGGTDGFVTRATQPTPPTVVTFAAGSATATLAITAASDSLTEGNETLRVTIEDGEGYNPGSSWAEATIENYAPPVIMA
jgi:hypothetical protein